MLIKEPAFQKFQMPKKAQELSDRCTAAFLDICSSQADRDRFAMLENRIQGLFAEVLDLKSKVLAGDEVYSLLTIKHGALFDPAVMSVHPADADREYDVLNDASTTDDQSQTSVKLCLFPALFVDVPGSSAELEEARCSSSSLIRLRNFEGVGADAVSGHKPLVKALVVLA